MTKKIDENLPKEDHKHDIYVTHYGLIDQPNGTFFISREVCQISNCMYEQYRLGEAVEE
jgi:hypothetical protein